MNREEIEILKREELYRLCAIIHSAARARGWWKDPATGLDTNRDAGQLLKLVDTEVLEAYQALMLDTRDEHLPHLSGYRVEVADAFIRICDLSPIHFPGWPDFFEGITVGSAKGIVMGNWDVSDRETLMAIPLILAAVLEAWRRGHQPEAERALAIAAFLLIKLGGDGFLNVVDQKLAYNAQRHDHSLEARRAEGGKKV